MASVLAQDADRVHIPDDVGGGRLVTLFALARECDV